jgi:hypothetical protein
MGEALAAASLGRVDATALAAWAAGDADPGFAPAA